MALLLEKKVCLITGAGRGIGAAIARRFVEEGACVYANDNRAGSVDEWAADIEGAPGIVRPLYFDITNTSQIKDAVMRIKRESQRIDVLVNNAGIEFNELIGMISEENTQKMFEVNVFSTIKLIQYASRIMAKGGGGSIINIASIVGQRGNRGQLVYSATKGAVIALTRSAAKELAEKNIRVNAVAPGLTATAMMLQADQSKLQDRISNIPMGRLAEPADIAGACLFLASDLSKYVSGETVGVNGCALM